MLKSLFIQNFVLIDNLDIRFDKGFSVITGETGAGKSIILGAIGLLLGQRADVLVHVHLEIGQPAVHGFEDRSIGK